VGEFGDKFRKAREKKELSFDDVSNVTKISSRMLRAIEDEHFDQLPGGVFNKGFIRAYAKHLGLNSEEAVTDYLACLRQAQIEAHEVWQPERPVSPRPTPIRPGPPGKSRTVEANQPVVKLQPPPQVPPQIKDLPDLHLPRAENVRPLRNKFVLTSDREIPWSILAIAGVVIVLGIVLWVRHSHRTNIAAAQSPAKTAQSATATVTTSTSPPTNQPPVNVPGSHSATPPAASTPPVAGIANNIAAPPGSLARKSPSAAKPIAPLTLVIRATETSWISLSADGQTVSQETLIAPAHTSIRANSEIVAKVGNAAGVTFLWNGREISAEGAEAEVKTFVFDSNGMRVLPSDQAPAQVR